MRVLSSILILLSMAMHTAPALGGSSRSPNHQVDSEHGAYFYHGLAYGSDALIHPLRLILNGGFGILQMENRSNQLTEVDYDQGLKSVSMNLANPIRAIEANGWWDFFSREVIPFSINSGKAHYWPNYMNHLIGGGMSYRMMVDWYSYHGYESPRMWAGITISAYHFLNEVVENDEVEGWSTDAVADVYIFDPLGVLLFSSERVCRFFSHTLHMADWSLQPALDVNEMSLHNNGQNFAVKWGLPWSERWSLFYHWGTHGEMGMSYRRSNGESISVGAGLKAKNFIQTGAISAVDLTASAGVFYDRDNSLLASLFYAKSKDYRWSLNLYPGTMRVGPFAPGFFAVLGSDGRTTLGFSMATGDGIVPVGYTSRIE